MAEVVSPVSRDVVMYPSDSTGDKEFDEFLNCGPSTNGFLSDSKENVAISNGPSKDASEVPDMSNDRIKWKAKRPSKFMVNRTNSDPAASAPLRALKNSRSPRNGFGRGLPKKGGAGGKGTWGALGSEVMEEESEETGTSDPKDPNYDDQNLDDKNLKIVTDTNGSSDNEPSSTPSKTAPAPKEEVPDEEICKYIHTTILEYYDHGDTEEAFMSFEELPWSVSQRHLVVVTAVEVAVDHKPSHREMTSVLLADLYHHSLWEHHYAKGYDKLIKNLDDLVIDAPEAHTILGNFIARSIADDCIPPKFLQGYKGQVDSTKSALCLIRAQSLLSMRHGLVRLDNVWGVGGGMRPVKHLVKKMSLLLQEYLSSNDVEEAQRCLVELEVPHFHHELVYEAVVMGLERLDERSLGKIRALLGALHASVVVTPHQMNEGFLRVFEDLPQICLDVPPAHAVLEKFVKACVGDKTITEELARKIPSRGRKRFVSEGDGGRIKDDVYC